MASRKLLSQLGHVEIATPCLEESTRFYVDVLGLTEVAREGSSVYLKCWGEWFHNSVVLTEASDAGVIHIGWRSQGPEELEVAVQRLKQCGAGLGWIDGAVGHGPAYRFRPPGGQNMEIYWMAERYQAPPELRSRSVGRPQRWPGRGACVRQLDHVTMPTADVEPDTRWWCETFGLRLMEYQVLEAAGDKWMFALVSSNEQLHDLGLLADEQGGSGRVHHVAMWVDQVDDVRRGLEALYEAGVPIEYGPGRHMSGENTYMYFREPGGMRIEMFSGGYRNYLPDWEPVRWRVPADGAHDQSMTPIPDSFLEVFPRGGLGALKIDRAVENPWVLEGIR
jgi:catechol 2,3-dioxygenase